MSKPFCFFGKSKHYTELRLRAKRVSLLEGLIKFCGSTKKELPSDNSLLIFLTYENDLRGKKIYQLQNRLHKSKKKIERLKSQLTAANTLLVEKKFSTIRVCPACQGSGLSDSGTGESKCYSCRGKGIIKVD